MADAGNLDLGWEAIKGLLASLVQAAFGFAGTILFARILGPVSFGGFYFVLSIIFLVNRPIWGFGRSVKKRFSEEDAPKGELVASIVVFNVVLIALTAVVLFGTDVLAGRTNLQSPNVVFVVLLGSMVFFFPFQMMVEAAGSPARATWIDTLRSVFTFPLQLGFVLAGFDAAGMGYGLAAATLLTIPLTYYSIGVRPAMPTMETFRSIWEFARYSIPSTFVGKAYDRFDVILLGAVLGTGIAGHYEVANKLTLPAMFLTGAISSGLMPKISNLDSRTEDPTTDVSNALSYTSILAIPMFFGVLAMPKRLVVTAFTAEYTAAAPYLVGLALYRVIASQRRVYRSTIAGLDMPRVNFRASVLTLGVNVVLGVALVFAIGGIGVVIATVVAESVQYLWLTYVIKRELPDVTVLPRTLLEQVGVGAVMFLAVSLLADVLVLDSILTVGVVVGAGAAVYGTVLFAVSRDLRVTVRGVYLDAMSG